MNVEDICKRAQYRPDVYVPALKDELIRLQQQEKEVERLRNVIRMALDSFEEDCPLVARQTLVLGMSQPS